MLHISVHLGGGAGKAISGMCINSQTVFENVVLLLEKPQNTSYVDRLQENDISVYIDEIPETISSLIRWADIVVLNWWSHPLMAKFLQDFPKIDCRLIIWNHINGCHYPYLPAQFLLKFDRIMFTSCYSEDNARWSFFEKEEIIRKASIVYGMGDFEPTKIRQKENYDNEGKEFVIGYVGTINYAKIKTDFLDYYQAVIENIPNVKFRMLGQVSSEILDEIQHRELEKYFDLPGYVENVADYYRGMDVFAYLLEKENYATTENSLLEAMAYGLPIVVMNNPVERYIVKDNVSGFLVDSKSEFVEKINCLRDKRSASLLGKSARKNVMDSYLLKDNIDEYMTACNKIMGMNKKKRRFVDVLGNTGYEAFSFFADYERQVFDDYLNGRAAVEDLLAQKNIFWEKEKSSVYQYARYYPDDRKLKSIVQATIL